MSESVHVRPVAPVKVSVLVMTYNHAKFIRPAIDSVLMQKTNFPFELVITEDCSTDGTREIVMDYRKRHPEQIRLLLSERNLHSNAVVSRGIRACRGDFVALLDGDDYWTDAEKLQRQVEFLENHLGCSVCFHNALTVYEDGSREPHHWTRPNQEPFMTRERIWRGNPIATGSTMFRNRLFELPTWYDEMPLTDWPIHVLNAEHGDIGYIDRVMSVYRIHHGGEYSKLDELTQFEQRFQFYRRMNQKLNHRCGALIQDAMFHYFLEWAEEYAQRGERGKAMWCARKCLAGRPSGEKTNSYKRLLRVCLGAKPDSPKERSNVAQSALITANSIRPPVNVALVGCGAVSELYYAPALRELEKIGLLRVTVLVDPNSKRTTALKQHFATARVSGDLAGIASKSVDLAIVASPPRYHAAQTIWLLQSGISVLCEKPMAATVAEAEAMIESAQLAQRPLAIGLFRRFFPATQTIRSILSQKYLGEVRSFHFAEGSAFRWPVKSEAYFQRNSAVGGVLLDIGSHLLDLMTWWMGEPSEVHYEDDAMGGIEANCRIRLTFPEGFSGEVRLSRDCDLPSRYVIQCSKGWLSWTANEAESIQVHFDGTTTALNCHLHENDSSRQIPGLGPFAKSLQHSFIAQLQNAVAAVRGTEKVFVSGEDALPGFRLIDRCYRQRALMPMGWLSDGEQARAQRFAHEVVAC